MWLITKVMDAVFHMHIIYFLIFKMCTGNLLQNVKFGQIQS